ncbi:MAG: hypothetical protein IJ457_09760 [Clostridia bacterium]|nr:hypothetical protein [Clostridia bacterium]
MEFYLLNDELQVVGILDRITHAQVTRRFFAPGSTSVTTAYGVKLPESARFLFEPAEGSVALIEKVAYPVGGTSVISGRSAECLFERQVLKRDGYFNGSVENAVKTVLAAFAVAGNAFPSLEVGNTAGLPDSAVVRFEWSDLSSWLYATLGRYGASYRLDTPDGEDHFIFNVVFGTDRSSLGDGKVVLIREDDASLEETSFSVDEKGYSNVICVVGNDGRYVTVESGEYDGFDRREGILQARDIYPASYETDDGYFDALRERGKARLASFSERIIFTGSATGRGAYVFGRDYFLGDICELETKSGKTLALRVTSVTDVYEKGVRRRSVRFGGDISSTAVIAD